MYMYTDKSYLIETSITNMIYN